MAGRGRSVRQTSYRVLCEAVRAVLLGAVESGGEVVGSVQCRAVAALYEVLMNHPVDRRGRCGSCRRPGAVLGRCRRRCRVHTSAEYWLHHRDAEFLRTHLAREFGLDTGPPTGTGSTRRPDPADAGSPPVRPGSLLLTGGGA